jgi:hypothetical protein|tara:strand:- start:160 stop:426 length:267 start_codon:yes stop_codon:yes gene_type:complete
MADKYVPVEDVAKLFSVTPHTVRIWVGEGKIDSDMYVKIGKTYRYDIQGIEKAFLGAKFEDDVKLVKEEVTEEVSDFKFGTDMLDEDF